MRWQKVTIIGVGLLGGSLGLALRRRRLADQVVGYVRRPSSIKESIKAGAVHHATMDLPEAITGADLIVLCTPLATMRSLFNQMLPHLRKGCVITDVGSAKVQVVKDLENAASNAGLHFVGSHPMAGSEQTGVAAAMPDLFEGAVCVVTPTSHSNSKAVSQVIRLWKQVGGTVLQLSPEKHDRIVSRTSHVPYFTAVALARLVLNSTAPADQPKLCATGFRDCTRIASGSPEMWRDIAGANRRQIAHGLAILIRELRQTRALILDSKLGPLQLHLADVKVRRDAWRSSFRNGS